MKSKKSKFPKFGAKADRSDPPVLLTLPNTIHQKMEAIVCIAKAVQDLAKAIDSVHTHVTISNCTFGNGGVEMKPE